MGRKRVTHAGMLVALACVSGCFQMNTSSTTEQDNDPKGTPDISDHS